MNWSPAFRNSVLLTGLIQINSITNSIKTMILNKSNLCKFWLLYNFTTVIDTPAQSSDIKPIENLCVHLKTKAKKRSPTNKNELIKFIKEEWEKIPSEYDIPKLF